MNQLVVLFEMTLPGMLMNHTKQCEAAVSCTVHSIVAGAVAQLQPLTRSTLVLQRSMPTGIVTTHVLCGKAELFGIIPRNLPVRQGKLRE